MLSVTVDQLLYRAYARTTPSNVSGYIAYDVYRVMKLTPCGAWIQEESLSPWTKLRWVGSYNFAQVSKEAARKSLVARKRRHVMFSAKRAENAKVELAVALQGLDGSLDTYGTINVISSTTPTLFRF
mgnify:CR=1 FL=1